MVRNLGRVNLGDAAAVVKAERSNWTHASEYWPKQTECPMYFFGSPVYAGDYIKYRSRSEQLLSQLPIRSLVAERLNQLYEKPVEHLPGSSFPGFHIFNGKGKCSSKFHIDSDYLERFPDCGYDLKDFYSFVVPVELPVGGCGLDLQEFHFPYTVGYLYVWKSNMLHRIPDIDLSENEYRITYQGHFILQPNKLLYYW